MDYWYFPLMSYDIPLIYVDLLQSLYVFAILKTYHSRSRIFSPKNAFRSHNRVALVAY